MKIWSGILGLAMLLVASVTSTGKAAFDYRLVAAGNFDNYEFDFPSVNGYVNMNFSAALMPVTTVHPSTSNYGLAIGDMLNFSGVQDLVELSVNPAGFTHADLVSFNTATGSYSFSSGLAAVYYNPVPEINSSSLFAFYILGTLDSASASSSTEALLFIFIAAENTLGSDPAWALIVPTTSTVPEPSTLAIMGLGVFGLAFHARRRRLAARS